MPLHQLEGLAHEKQFEKLVKKLVRDGVPEEDVRNVLSITTMVITESDRKDKAYSVPGLIPFRSMDAVGRHFFPHKYGSERNSPHHTISILKSCFASMPKRILELQEDLMRKKRTLELMTEEVAQLRTALETEAVRVTTDNAARVTTDNAARVTTDNAVWVTTDNAARVTTDNAARVTTDNAARVTAANNEVLTTEEDWLADSAARVTDNNAARVTENDVVRETTDNAAQASTNDAAQAADVEKAWASVDAYANMMDAQARVGEDSDVGRSAVEVCEMHQCQTGKMLRLPCCGYNKACVQCLAKVHDLHVPMCPNPSCKKRFSKDILSAIDRLPEDYDEKQKKARYDMDPHGSNMFPCEHCQMLVDKDRASIDGMVMCVCGKISCTKCHCDIDKHVGNARCKSLKMQNALKKYEALVELINANRNIKIAPCCGLPVQKVTTRKDETELCNLMTCKCMSTFCWLCLKVQLRNDQFPQLSAKDRDFLAHAHFHTNFEMESNFDDRFSDEKQKLECLSHVIDRRTELCIGKLHLCTGVGKVNSKHKRMDTFEELYEKMYGQKP